MPRRRRPPRAGALTELPPLKIAGQIATLQGLYYAAALALMVFTALVAGRRFTWGLVLGWEHVRGDTTQGWLQAFVWLLDGGFCMSLAIVALIARSKLVPDFALTIHLVHLVVVTLYSGSLPRHTMWWATMFVSSAVSVALGMWACRYRELQPVFFGGGRILGGGGGTTRRTTPPRSSSLGGGRGTNAVVGGEAGGLSAEEAAAAADEEEEMVGFPRGSARRGRGRDGVGEYEMVKMETTPR